MGISGRHHFIANLPSEACSIFTPGLAWLLAGLRTRRHSHSSEWRFLLTHLPGFGENQWLWVFVPAYRCGAAPDLHRIPFKRSLGNATSKHQNDTALAASSQSKGVVGEFVVSWCFLPLLLCREHADPSAIPRSSLLHQTLASCFYTSASRCVERDAINATRPVF